MWSVSVLGWCVVLVGSWVSWFRECEKQSLSLRVSYFISLLTLHLNRVTSSIPESNIKVIDKFSVFGGRYNATNKIDFGFRQKCIY